jgi:uncharacterized protein YndB with AHSA1/START domain
MIPNQIEREILIEAPVESVWRAVTEPGRLSAWFCDEADIDMRPGAAGTMTWTDKAAAKPATAHVTVQAVEPPRRFAFRWSYPEGAEPTPSNSLLVEFTLTPEGEHTRLRLVESGLSAVEWPDGEKQSYVDDHSKGWDTHMPQLRDYVTQQARQAHGAPSGG